MKKIIFIGLIILFITLGIFAAARRFMQKTAPISKRINQQVSQDSSSINNANQSTQSISGFEPPLDRIKERVTKKPFGIYITPATSPIQPERFQGYHTGTDFEIFPEELNADVPVHAVCSGKLLVKEYASGYGGVAVESCSLDSNPITVIYGHLKLSSISNKAGSGINVGDTIGILGADKSVETDGERKHLHLGFHKGSLVNIRGYVQLESGLSEWIDPCLYVCSN